MPSKQKNTLEHTDTLIIGAGLSGIGAAYYLKKEHPTKSFVLLEAREVTGGTWDLFKYPGIRSDSDLHTFGYEFKPWVDNKAIANADKILDYLREAAIENDINRHIRFQHSVCSAAWSTDEACWHVEIERMDTGERFSMTCNWLFSAAGYYRYDQGYTPEFEGVDKFNGQLIHPQKWPEDLDYQGKRVLVIGSGATAVTLVPAMTDKAKHVTMLQRTPSYIMSLPSADVIANVLRKLLPSALAYRLTRRKNIAMSRAVWRFCQRFPKLARRVIRFSNKRSLPKGYPVDEHFNPPYNPWDQRLCVVPDGDLFNAISEEKASVVTDHIDTFTEKGVRLKSGQELEADIIVTATGLNLQAFGGINMIVDGKTVEMPEKVAYKGMMLSGIPNFAFAIGYTNASWTLKIGLLCEHLCRIMRYMDRHDKSICCPELPSPNMPTRPLLDFGAGYVQRALSKIPRQGKDAPWLVAMDYNVDIKLMRDGPVEDPNLKFYSSASEQKPQVHTRSKALEEA
ncbi:flavin-containing monooxygenase [Alkalimarinus alittae]|uniref:NAD(P)/FAD-dependent oxidoreductase n=1 Tax=Alkalimarinus alittae TaxID=2961619 RepID=A0ABY6N3M7_9ALTE|nr:NAD(P)/FAD-dependent oxidoreductase [Alkalimarinus alittae]UZE96589.1 NAD(P)/FAD-dependent oxidoreductase [Alkalimarinus alittae]